MSPENEHLTSKQALRFILKTLRDIMFQCFINRATSIRLASEVIDLLIRHIDHINTGEIEDTIKSGLDNAKALLKDWMVARINLKDERVTLTPADITTLDGHLGPAFIACSLRSY